MTRKQREILTHVNYKDETVPLIDQDQAWAGRSDADDDWAAGSVRTNQEVARWNDSSYSGAYIARIRELQAGHSWRADRDPDPEDQPRDPLAPTRLRINWRDRPDQEDGS